MPQQSPASGAMLTVRSPDGEVREFPLTDDPLTIGRAPESAIYLSDPRVSRYHATVRRQDGQYVIFDAGSQSGIFVNGQRVGTEGQALRQGDIVIIGQTHLTFGVQTAGHPLSPVKLPPAKQTVESVSRVFGRLNIVLPSGEIVEALLVGPEMRIGAGDENEVVLDDPAVSRKHAIIRLENGQLYIFDAGSRNGVFVNGQRIGPAGQPIRPGDAIRIGQSRLSIISGLPAADLETVKEGTLQDRAAPQHPSEPVAQAFPAAQPSVEVGKAEAQVGLKKILLDGRYELEEKLAQDSTGTLYRARRVLLGDKVAVRVLRPELVSDPVAVERFRRQAQVAVRIRHPNSVPIYDFGSSPEGTVYIVEELLSGRTLRDLVYKEFGLTLPRVIEIFNQICGAVHAAHLSGIVLRDIKPESIFVDEALDGREVFKVGGYGLAKLDSSTSNGMTVAGQVKLLGTPQYMSPEQWLDGSLDSRSDVYSLGVILFELLTGVVPFDAATPEEIARLHLKAPVPDISEFGRQDLGEEIAAVINRALAKDPNRRQPTALNLAAELQAVAGPGRIFGGLISRATGLMPMAPVVLPREPSPAPAGEAYLPSVVAQVEPKGRGAFNPIVLALMVEAFLSRISSGLIKTAVPLYALLVFGLDITSVMVLVLIQNVVPLLLRPLFGSLADRYGKKRIFLISLTIRTVVGIFYAIATLPLLYVVSLVRGVADSAKGPSASAMIADNTDERDIAKAYSWYTTTKSTSGGIGEAVAAFLLVTLIVFYAGTQTVTANVAVLNKFTASGTPLEEFLKSPDEVAADRTLPPTETHPEPRKVVRVEQRQMALSEIPINDLPKVVDATLLRNALVVIFIAATLLSALSLFLVAIFIKEKRKEKSKQKAEARRPYSSGPGALPERQPSVWAFALLGTALTAPAYMVTGEFFTVLAVKLDVTATALGWIKIIAETIVPLFFGPFFGWLADRIGAVKVVTLRSVANIATSALFWITPWFIGTALLGLVMGLARGIDEIGKAAFKPTWGAIAAKVSSFNLANRARTMGIMEGGVDASDLAFPVLAGVLLQYLSLGFLMAMRAVLALIAEVYGFILMRKYKI